MNSTLAKNLEILSQRFPTLAERLASTPLPQIQKTASQDGGYCYVHQTEDGKWKAITDPVNPIARAQKAVMSMEDRIGSGFAPAVVLGLDPGYTLEIIFKHFKENYYEKFIKRRIYVIIDSTACLFGWLNSEDRTEILSHESVEFYWHQEARRIVRLCKKDETRSHLFIPISSLPEATSVAIMEPLAQFFISRQEEEQKLLEENNKYYTNQTDRELNKIISGKSGRKPRLLIPSHASSTVVQYSVRDTAAMFEKEGWEVKIMHMKTDLSCWRINKNINEFKPDVYLLINHLRTEDTSFYPKDMMFVTWVQDTVSYINNSESAEAWNKHVKSNKKRRDLIIGYVGQIKQYGYQEDRLTECPMIVNQDLFKEREITAEDRAKYECDICFASNRSKETSLIVKEDLLPKLEKFGFTEDILMTMHDHLWEYYREEKTCVGYIQLEDKIIELPEVCELIEKLINKDDHDFVIQRIYWLLNDVIYRHIVIEWISEMKGIKLHLYGRGWEDHPKFSKYAKGILNHGEELSLAYQCAKHCLHLNSLEGEHQRLTEIIDAKGNPITRLSIDKEILERQKFILKGSKNLKKPNLPFLNTLWHTSKTTLEKHPKSKFHKKLNKTFANQLEAIKVKLKQESISFSNKEYLTLKSSSQHYDDKLSKDKAEIYYNLHSSFTNKKKRHNKDLIPVEVSSFIFKLFEGKRRVFLPEYPQLETNLFCKTILTTDNNDKEKTYKSVRKNIHFDLLDPEYIPNYINWKFTHGEEKEVEPLIQKAYKKSLNVYDLNFKLAVKNYKEDKNWYQKARKDLVKGRISIQAAGQLATLSVKWADEKKVINDILNYGSQLQNIEKAEAINLLPIFSQSLKLLGKSKLNQLANKISDCVSVNLISKVIHAAQLENDIKAERKYDQQVDSFDIYRLILEGRHRKAKHNFIHIGRPKKLLKFADNSLCRGNGLLACKIYAFLNKVNVPLSQSQSINVINSKIYENKRNLISFIKLAYQNNESLHSLYTHYAINDKLGNGQQSSIKDALNHTLSINHFLWVLSQIDKKEEIKAYLHVFLKHHSNFISLEKINFSQLFKLSFIAQGSLSSSEYSKLNSYLSEKLDIELINEVTDCLEILKRKSFNIRISKNVSQISKILYYTLNEKSHQTKRLPIVEQDKQSLQSIGNQLLKYKLYEEAFLIFEFLVSREYKISQYQAETSLNSHCSFPKSRIKRFIETCYQSNENLTDLYCKYSLKKVLLEKNWYKYALLDLSEYSKLTLSSASQLITKSVKNGSINFTLEYVLSNFSKLKEIENANFLQLFPIYDEALNSNKKKYIDQIENSLRVTGLEKLLLAFNFFKDKKPSIFSGKLETFYDKNATSLYNLIDLSSKSLNQIANNFWERKQEDIAHLIFKILYKKNTLNKSNLINFLTLERDKDPKHFIYEFRNLIDKSSNKEAKLMYSFTKMITNQKLYRFKNNSPHILASLIYCELKQYNNAINLLPSKNNNKISLLWHSLVYFLCNYKTLSNQMLKEASNGRLDLTSVKNEKFRSFVINTVSKHREKPNKLIMVRYMLFKFKYPNQPFIEINS